MSSKGDTVDDLIEALTILRKYVSGPAAKYPTNCSHDVMWVNVEPSKVSGQDLARLDALGFFPAGYDCEHDEDGEIVNLDDAEGFQSFRFGSS